MKKIIKPHEPEEAVYYSDFKGICCENNPPVEVHIGFHYGSQYDGGYVSLDLTDEEAEELLAFIKSKVTPEKLKNLQTNNWAKYSLGDNSIAADISRGMNEVSSFFSKSD